MSNDIHPTAMVSKEANLGDGNLIGPFAIIEEGVVIGQGNCFAAHCLVRRGATIGDHNMVCEHSVLGSTSREELMAEPRSIFMGNSNILREGVRVCGGSEGTHIGNGNYLMAYVQVSSDCQLSNEIVMANNVILGKQVHVGNKAFISGGVVINESSHVGRLAMVGGNSRIKAHVLPYFITDGIPARVRGINSVGLKRAGFQSREIRNLKKAFRILLRSELPLRLAVENLKPTDSPHVQHLLDFTLCHHKNVHS